MYCAALLRFFCAVKVFHTSCCFSHCALYQAIETCKVDATRSDKLLKAQSSFIIKNQFPHILKQQLTCKLREGFSCFLNQPFSPRLKQQVFTHTQTATLTHTQQQLSRMIKQQLSRVHVLDQAAGLAAHLLACSSLRVRHWDFMRAYSALLEAS